MCVHPYPKGLYLAKNRTRFRNGYDFLSPSVLLPLPAIKATAAFYYHLRQLTHCEVCWPHPIALDARHELPGSAGRRPRRSLVTPPRSPSLSWWVADGVYVDKMGESVGGAASETPRKRREGTITEVQSDEDQISIPRIPYYYY